MISSALITDFILETTYESLPKGIVHQMKRTLMDYLCVTILGSTSSVSNNIFNYFKSIDNGDCTVIGRTAKITAPNAAFVNGTSAHSLDFDDGHRLGALHPASVIYPTVMALAEKYHLPAKQVIEGVIIGYDLMIRLAISIHPGAYSRGFHNTPLAGIFGAAGAAAKLLKLDRNKIINALGLAGSFAGGLRTYMQNGADVKRIHPGKAARDGIVCGELAKHGITGPPAVLEGINGFYQCYTDKADINVLLNKLGSNFEILNVYFKPYPACRHLHSPIECIINIKHKVKFDPSTVSSIKVGTYKSGKNYGSKNYSNLLETQMSIPCAIATAIIHDQITLDSFMPETFYKLPILKELVNKTELFVDEECESMCPTYRPSKVTIELSNGEKIMEQVVLPRGSVERPLSDADIEDKFKLNCEPIIGRANCEKIIEQIWNFEKQQDLSFIYSGGLQ